MKRLRRLVRVGGMLSLAPLLSTDLPPQLLPVYGGSGGAAFSRDCGSGKVMTGLRFRAGVVLDAVGLLCRPVLANGTLGSESTVGTLVGGGGGSSGTRSCAKDMVVVGALIEHGTYINILSLVCRTWKAAKRGHGLPEEFTAGAGFTIPTSTRNAERCEVPTQPSAGIRGRAGSLVDAIGFICDEP